MRYLVTLLFFAVLLNDISAQDNILKVGDPFPSLITLNQLVNTPVHSLNLYSAKKQFYILNFWGTWCSPCIPEMDNLAKIQNEFGSQLQIIGISNDDSIRLKKYIKRKPSKIWLASDPQNILYQLVNLSFVGQSIILNPQKKIIGMVRTDSINKTFVSNFLKGDSIHSNAAFNDKLLSSNNVDAIFNIDSSTQFASYIRPFVNGVYTSTRIANRRITCFNFTLSGLYRTAFKITTERQIIYEDSLKEKDVADFDNESTLYCVDFLVKPSEKDSLIPLFQNFLNANFPIKARLEKRTQDVLLLEKIPDSTFHLPISSDSTKASKSFSGIGFDGTKVSLQDFATDYLANEFGYPVINNTGEEGKYDIKTNVEIRDYKGIQKSLRDIGLILKKGKREIPVLIYYKPKSAIN
ncbi:redoxin domain-containing protein [Rhizosphaericola mali]|uniref:Redoxin domain-containing protein n=1 Tax=Rhizosphaericola mali TaxID=2545455 RepID=A0A5P2G5R0_9BACT|nr:redoxin domain-containing protein [Rhizosphaericola mali]QES90028.1 redoxin domain-containing protein [Rhizosphaericola mali]